MHGREACVAGGHAWWGHAWQGVRTAGGGMCGRGVCVAGGVCMAGETAAEVNGTHTTDMNFCLFLMLTGCSVITSNNVVERKRLLSTLALIVKRSTFIGQQMEAKAMPSLTAHAH